MKTERLSGSKIIIPRYRHDVIQGITQLLEGFDMSPGEVVWDTLEVRIEREETEDITYADLKSTIQTYSRISASVITVVEDDA